MASITIVVGALTATVTTTDAKANAILTQYGNSIGASGTNQQKLNQVMAGLVKHMQQQGRQHRGYLLQQEAMTAAQAEMDALWWDQPDSPPP